MLDILIKILGFSFEILGISKTCDNRIPYLFITISAKLKLNLILLMFIGARGLKGHLVIMEVIQLNFFM